MNLSRIILGLILIIGAGGALAGATSAFFSDTETSTGNTFTAGDIDLKIDNESYYNGVLNQGTTWTLTDLTIEKFFDFDDVKPADYGEDTISIHVETNDAYLCANVTLTSDDDNTQTEPEALDDPNGLAAAELADEVNFIWWADDGDNVLESDENVISQGPIGALTLNSPFTVSLADSVSNIWNPGNAPGPIAGGDDYFIGKAWCFGAIGASPITQDNSGALMSPAGNNNGNGTAGEPEDGGITCDGSGLGNEAQTDSLTADVSFEAVQSRNNPNFVCEDCELTGANLILNEGFELPGVVNPAQWDIFPSPVAGWNVEWRGDIPATFGPQNRPAIANLEIHRGVLGSAFVGQQYVELDTDWGGPSDSGNGEPASVAIYQDIATIPGVQYKIHFAFAPRPDTAATDNDLEVRWGGVVVDALGPTAGAAGPIVWTPFDIIVTATTTTTRVQFTDLGTANSLGTFLDDVRVTQESCPSAPPQGEATATLTLQKTVVNDDEGGADDSEWTLVATGPTPISGAEGDAAVTSAVVAPGAYVLSESGGPAGYTASQYSCVINGGAPIVSNNLNLADGDSAVCTITNDDEENNEPTAILTESFGTGVCLQDIPGWDEDAGESCTNGTVAAAIGTGDNTASPDGGRFAMLSGNNGFICRSVNAAGLDTLVLKYYWRGDGDADAGETGSVKYFTGGTCAAPTGVVNLASHALTTTSWSSQQTINLPGSLDNTTFFVRFTADSNGGNESFRVDGISLTGTPI